MTVIYTMTFGSFIGYIVINWLFYLRKGAEFHNP